MYSKLTILNVTLNDSTWVPITLDTPLAASVVMECRSEVAVMFYVGSQSEYFTLKSGRNLELDVKSIEDPIMYAKSASGTVVLEIFVYERVT
jgi:hypothetical protein